MAKKDKKKKDRQGSGAADAVEAVRSAVERTFQATTEGAVGTQKRTRELVDEVAHVAARIRETIEDLRLLEDVRGLRGEIEALARRVAALEARDGKAASDPSAASGAAASSKASGSATSPRPAAAKTRSTASRAKGTSSGTKAASPGTNAAGAESSPGTRARSSSSRSTGSRSSAQRSPGGGS
jgi:hypothetical protein